MCLGSIDGKHIAFRPPRSSGSFYYNYKGYHSIVLMAISDANYKFTYIDVGVNGRISDGGVFRECSFKKAMDLNILSFPKNKNMPGQSIKVPYVFLADDAFSLSTRIMKPFPNRGLTREKRIFNYRLSRARRVVENAFGILSNRFRVLLNPINLSADKVETIVLATCVLHNFLAEKNHRYTEVENNQNSLQSLQQQAGNRVTQDSIATRHYFTDYFSTDGAVSWQNDVI